MPTPNSRPSLTTNIETRYSSQRAGGAFDVKATLGGPGTQPLSGETIDAASQLGAQFQSPNGFQVKMRIMQTQLLDAQGNTSKQLSTYVKGLDTRRYHP